MNIISKISIAFFLCFLAFNLFIFSDIFINYPFLDDFGAIVNFMVDYDKTKDLPEIIKLLFSQNNDFRLVVLKLITLSDFYIFGEINFKYLRIVGFLFFLSTMIYFFKLGKFRLTQFQYFLPVPLLMISFAYAEINGLAMESLSHFVVIFFAASTFYFLFKKNKLWIPIVLMLFGIYSNGNGLLLIPIGFLGLLIRKEYRRFFIWTTFSVLAILTFFWNYEKGNTPLDLMVFKRIAYVFPIYLGGIGGMESIKINMVFGVLGITLAIYFLFIRKSYQKYTTLSALMLFFLGTYLLISSKRQYTDSSALLRGAYLINSVCIYVIFYVLFYQIHLKTWIEKRQIKLANWSILGILLVCFVYQGRNYTRWIQIFGYQKRAIQDVMVNINGNTAQLYADEGVIHNIPLNMRPGLDTLLKKQIFNNQEAIERLIIKPLNQTLPEISGKFNNSIEILSIDGTQIQSNPMITISAKIKDYLKNPLNGLGVVLNQNGQSSFFEIPLKNDKLFLIKPVKGRDYYFEFMIPKNVLKTDKLELEFLKFENKKTFISETKLEIEWEDEKNTLSEIAKPSKLAKGQPDVEGKVSKSKLIDAYYADNKHEIVVQLDSSLTSENNYLQFTNTESSSEFILPLSKKSDKLAHVIFEQVEMRNFLKGQNGLYRLSINSGGQHLIPLKSLYYFNFY
jgi:hypothetical protein